MSISGFSDGKNNDRYRYASEGGQDEETDGESDGETDGETDWTGGCERG